MDLIIGGCHQGKTQYVKEHYGLTGEEILLGEHVLQGQETGKRCLFHFHLLVRSLLEQQMPVREYLEVFLEKNDFEVIVSDEIGYGIVPVDVFEREYREMTGRECCRLAAQAERVIRVTAGIGWCIKGE